MASKLVRNSLLLGAGLSAMARKAIEEKIRELEKDGDIDPDEAQKLVEEIAGQVAETRDSLVQTVRSEVDRALKASPIATKKELAALEEKFAQYKRNMASYQVDHTAVALLKRRYAKGEISKKQYEQMKKDLLK
ncbi:MAG: SHOCT domain-containing protein [Candidatus Micrarchaeia archaeon]|jgi:polyhydroxyalkanoate synthesis regulator phasin